MPSILAPDRLQDAIEASIADTQWTRDLFALLLTEFTGQHYGDGDGKIRTENKVAEAVMAMRPTLCRPSETVVLPLLAGAIGTAAVLETKLNLLAERLRLHDIERQAVEELLFTPFCAVRVGLSKGEEVAEVEGLRYEGAGPCVQKINYEDMAFDTAAKSPQTRRWIGDRYPVIVEAALDYGIFGQDPAEVQALGLDPAMVMTPQEAQAALAGAKAREDTDDRDRPSMGMGLDGTADRYRMVRSVEVWRICVFDINGQTYEAHLLDGGKETKFLKIVPYHGLGRSPYELCSFIGVPTKSIELPYGASLLDIHEAARATGAKFTEDIVQAKTVLAARPGAEKQALKVRNARHREIVSVEPDAIKAIETPLRTKDILIGLTYLNGQFNKLSGNVQLEAGTDRTQSNTATRDSILAGNASKRSSDMQEAVTRFRTNIRRRLAFYELDDPATDEMIGMRTPGGQTIDILNRADLREATLDQLDISIEVDEDANTDPAVRRAQYGMYFREVMPIIMQYVQMGAMRPMALRASGKLFGVKDIESWLGDQVLLMMAMSQQPAMMPGSPMMPNPQQPAAGPPGPPQRGEGVNEMDTERSARMQGAMP